MQQTRARAPIAPERANDLTLTGAIRERRRNYVTRSHPVTEDAVATWPMLRRLRNNLIATLEPAL